MSVIRYVIGLTGNIGTGKSTVRRMLDRLGAETIDADKIAHQTIEPDGPAYQAVVDAFGPAILRDDGTIDRSKLSNIVFNDSQALEQLEGLTHPAVGELIARRIENAGAPVVVVEAIKLIEAGLHNACDAVWIVTADREQQIQRLLESRGLDRGAAETRLDAQPPIEPKLTLADVVIDNSGTKEMLWEQVRAAWNQIPAEERRAIK